MRAAPHAPSVACAEFRDGASLSDPDKIARALETAVRGLETMKKYTTLDKRSSHWRVNLEEDPLGEKDAQQRRAEAFHAQQTAAAAARKLA